MNKNWIDIPERLRWIRNACENLYHTPATVEATKRSVPYVKVGTGLVRIVIFAKTRKVRVFFKLEPDTDQLHAEFDLDDPVGGPDAAVKRVAAFACGMVQGAEERAKPSPKHTYTFLEDVGYQCNDCGAFAENQEDVLHYPACKPGDSIRWMEQFNEQADRMNGEDDSESEDDQEDWIHDQYETPDNPTIWHP